MCGAPYKVCFNWTDAGHLRRFAGLTAVTNPDAETYHTPRAANIYTATARIYTPSACGAAVPCRPTGCGLDSRSNAASVGVT